MALRATAHPADVLNGLSWHEGCPYQQRDALRAVVSVSEEAALGLALMDQIWLVVSFMRGPL